MKKVGRKKLVEILISEAVLRQRLEVDLCAYQEALGLAEQRIGDLEARLRELGVRP